jgi:hypothetical protein
MQETLSKIKVLYRDLNYELQDTEVDQLNSFGGANIGNLQVLKSAAGYYLGDLYFDKDMAGWFPYSRESNEYWSTREQAEEALRTGNYFPKF